jgi:hypothetical protein
VIRRSSTVNLENGERPRSQRWQRFRRFNIGFFALIGFSVSVLALYVWFGFGGCHSYAPTKSVETSARTIRAAAQNWQATTNSEACPTVAQLITEKHLDSTSNMLDAWGHPFRLKCTDGEVFVGSAGPDGTFGTRDDIQIPKVASP